MATPSDPRLLQALLRSDFGAFVHKVFATLSPGQEFTPNWHLSAIAHELERVRRGELKRLKPRDREIVWDRFVVGKTLEEIGFEHGLTRERVRQICIEALNGMTERYQAMTDSDER